MPMNQHWLSVFETERRCRSRGHNITSSGSFRIYLLMVANEITLHGSWLVRAPRSAVFDTLTNFERWPEYFPKVAESIRVAHLSDNRVSIDATVKSFGQRFPVSMTTQLLPGEGFISDNESPKFGTSGHEEVRLTDHSDGTVIDYTYQVTIHRRWLRPIAKPLISGFSMKYWEKAVIEELRNRLE